MSLEARTIDGIELHFKHICSVLGDAFPIAGSGLADLQTYVDQRAKREGIGGGRLSAATIRKTIVSLRTDWNRAARMKLVIGH